MSCDVTNRPHAVLDLYSLMLCLSWSILDMKFQY